MLSPTIYTSLGLSEADIPYLNLERDWGLVELPDSTPDYPSFCLHGEVTLRPRAASPEERVVWVNEPKRRPQIIGDAFVRLAAQGKATPKECIRQCGSKEACICSTTNEEGATQPLDADKWRACTVVITDNPFDAIAAHSLLAANARRRAYFKHKQWLEDNGRAKEAEALTPDKLPVIDDYLHFAFLANPRKFDKPVRRLQQVAQTIILAPGTDFMACQRAFSICNRYADILFLSMPMLGEGIVTFYDFILRYQLSLDERIKYNGNKAAMLFDLMAGAITIDPFLRTSTIDKKTGNEKDYNFQLQIRSAWLLMQSRGYARVIDPTQPDKVGRYYHITGYIVDEVNRESLMASCLNVLTEYARSKAKLGTPDFAKMAQAIRTAKTLNAATASDLPIVTLDRRLGYGASLDHIFLRNGVIRIKPKPARFEWVSYDDLGFFVDAPAILPWDFDTSLLPSVNPEAIDPFDLFENPEYLERKRQLDEAGSGPNRVSPKELGRMSRELYDWARLNRWRITTKDTDWHHWWPIMKVIRAFANEEWAEEEELEYAGEHFTPEQQLFLEGRMISICATMGRIAFRHRDPNFLHYIMENGVSAEGKAEGGSGKSVFVNSFIACARNVLAVDSKKLNSRDDIEVSVVFNAFRPGYHDVVHVEDYERDIKRFYNYITNNFEFRKFHTNETRIRADEAPSIVITSNYAVRDGMDDSSAGRLNLCGFSHFFHRENENLNLMRRGFEVFMPKFNKSPERMDPTDRSQIIYVIAKCIQFVMDVQDKVLAPAKNLKERNMRSTLGDSFYVWASDFFSHDYNLRCPIDFQTIFNDYIDLSGSSEDKQNKFSAKAFTQRLQQYCANTDIAYMPDVAYKSDSDRLRKCMNLRAWIKVKYFDDPKVWGDRMKVVRELKISRKAICFYPIDQVPKNYNEVKEDFQRFWQSPDPCPEYDSDGNLVVVSPEEKRTWEEYLKHRQGKSAYEIQQERNGQPATPSATGTPSAPPTAAFPSAPTPSQPPSATSVATPVFPESQQQPMTLFGLDGQGQDPNSDPLA